ncbi:RidA family protein [Kibdelosporangium aridum]|uniref:Enamine deaminase RidA, house cleaning of reactive enamine intermediates, YjgF/YER057c/UK114 family n=1 Tax=Kibdelosporangium aridum TaxID=2030 RepID=A0A1W2FMF0_KIBAR|nr:RidA family protein [Kibdelosporangium aridum]SMD22924.1 Enamine deaminase RidA, house cleaning of reactive enamine intermediates, YjgF/YER057c/UK114 family [Kibdelosporangium aridum]
MGQQETTAVTASADGRARLIGPYSKIADTAADLVFIGGITPHLPSGVLVRSFDQVTADGTSVWHDQMLIDVPEEPAAAQAYYVFEELVAVLDSYGLDIRSLARLRLFVSERENIAVVNRVVQDCLAGHRPAISVVLVSSSGLDEKIEVYLDAVAYTGDGGVEVVDAGDGSTAVRAGDYVFVPNTTGTEPLPAPSRLGQLPDDLAALQFSTPKGAEVLQQSWTLFQRMDAALEAAGGGIEDVLKVNGWLADSMRNYGPAVLVRHALSKQNEKRLVASTGLSIGGLADRAAHIGYESVAYAPRSRGGAKEVRLPQADIARFYVGAVQGGDLVFTSGEVPIDGANRRLVDSNAGLSGEGRRLSFGHVETDTGMRARAWYVYQLHTEYLKAYGLDLTDVIHQTVYLKDASEMATVERVGTMFFGPILPPTTFVPIVDTSPFREASIEIEVVARQR